MAEFDSLTRDSASSDSGEEDRVRNRRIWRKRDVGRSLGKVFSAVFFLLSSELGCAAQDENKTVGLSIGLSQPDGKTVCNPSAGFKQIDEHTDLFVGFGNAIVDDCHNPTVQHSYFLGLFRMNLVSRRLELVQKLLNTPAASGEGITINKAYDPYAVRFKGETWLAFECTAPSEVSTCLAPIEESGQRLNLRRLSVPVRGTVGPDGSGKKVALTSASAPTLLVFHNKMYLYWQVSKADGQLPDREFITRGMEVKSDALGKMWGVQTDQSSIRPDDTSKSVIVHDVNVADSTANHIALTTDVFAINERIVEIAAVGGTEGPEVCHSTHQKGVGCWRPTISVSNSPLGYNVFGTEHNLRTSLLPDDVVEYARRFVDNDGHEFLMGHFSPMHGAVDEHRTKYESQHQHANALLIPFPFHVLVSND